jgi:hypothetical protein
MRGAISRDRYGRIENVVFDFKDLDDDAIRAIFPFYRDILLHQIGKLPAESYTLRYPPRGDGEHWHSYQLDG